MFRLHFPDAHLSPASKSIPARQRCRRSFLKRLVPLSAAEGEHPSPPAPHHSRQEPGGGHRAKAAERRGTVPRAFCWLVFSLNVQKLNACFESLIRLSSFCHLLCFVMHYIQLHISNPQILPRHQSTCQAFPFRSRCIKGLSRLAHTTERRDALAAPTAAMLRTWEPPTPKAGSGDDNAPSLALRRALVGIRS